MKSVGRVTAERVSKNNIKVGAYNVLLDHVCGGSREMQGLISRNADNKVHLISKDWVWDTGPAVSVRILIYAIEILT